MLSRGQAVRKLGTGPEARLQWYVVCINPVMGEARGNGAEGMVKLLENRAERDPQRLACQASLLQRPKRYVLLEWNLWDNAALVSPSLARLDEGSKQCQYYDA